MDHILYRSEETGNAWWPVDLVGLEISFENGQEYMIFGTTYPVNTGPFRKAWDEAYQQTTWEILNKRSPLIKGLRND